MRWVARAMALLLALATAAGGGLLLAPHVTDLGIAIPDRYALLGGFLLYCAMVIAVRAAFGGVTTRSLLNVVVQCAFGGIALMAVVCITGGLAILGLFAGRHWAGLLLIPAAGGLLSMLRPPRVGRAEVGPEEVGITPQSGQSLGLADTLRSALATAFSVFIGLLPFLCVPFGMVLFVVLKALLFGPAPMSAAQVLEALAAESWLIGLIAGLPAFGIFIIVVLSGIASRLRMFPVPDANRLLSLRELGFIENCFAETADYADRAHYPEPNISMTAWTVLGYALLATLCIAVFVWFERLPPLGPDTAQLWFWSGVDTRLSVKLFFGTGVLLFMTGLPRAVIARFWPRFAERAGWQRLVEGSGFAGVTERLLLLVRLHWLSEPFEVRAFLRSEGRRISPLWFYAIALMAGATAFASLHDRAKIDVVRPSGIDITDWWTLRTTHIAFKDVEALQLHCALNKNGSREIGIVLRLPGGGAIDLSRGRVRDDHSFGRIDEQLRRARTPVQFLRDDKGRSLYDPACVHAEAKANGSGAPVVLHLDDWGRQTKKR